MNAPVRFFGGKGTMFNSIIEHFPNKNLFDTYIEPFAGSYSIGLKNCSDVPIEIYNDLNKNVYSLYKVLQDDKLYKEFKQKCDLMIYNEDFREEYRKSLKTDELDVVERAYRFFYVNRTSHNGIGGFSINTIVRRNMSKSVSDMLSAIDRMDELHQRLSKLIVTNMDAFKLIERHKNNENVMFYCFDKETEILTNNGWKFLSDCDIKNDLFLSREPLTKKIEWVPASHYINYHYKGKMYHYEGKEVDLMVTPDHKLFVKNVHKNDKGDEYFDTAQNLFRKYFKFISAGGIWEGNDNKFIVIDNKKYDLKKFAYIFGMWLTDGSINCRNAVTITQKKTIIYNKVKQCLVVLSIDFSEYKNTFYIKSPYSKYFQQFGTKDKRFIPLEIKNANKEVLLSCLEGIIDGDGDNSKDKNGLFGSRRISMYYNKKLLSDIQEIIYKVGMSSSYTLRLPRCSLFKKENRYIHGKIPYMVISIKNKQYISHDQSFITKKDKWVDYDDMVYCVTLEKWHTVLVRRNGKCIWCGQCDPPYHWDTRTSARYETDMNNEQHLQFIDLVVDSKAKMLISGYDHVVYDKLVENGWQKIQFEVNTTSGNKKPKTKIETLWKNY